MIEQAIDESLELSVHDKQISVAMCGSSAIRPDTPLLGCIAPTADGNSVRPFRVSQFGFTLRVCVSECRSLHSGCKVDAMGLDPGAVYPTVVILFVGGSDAMTHFGGRGCVIPPQSIKRGENRQCR